MWNYSYTYALLQLGFFAGFTGGYTSFTNEGPLTVQGLRWIPPSGALKWWYFSHFCNVWSPNISLVPKNGESQRKWWYPWAGTFNNQPHTHVKYSGYLLDIFLLEGFLGRVKQLGALHPKRVPEFSLWLTGPCADPQHLEMSTSKLFRPQRAVPRRQSTPGGTAGLTPLKVHARWVADPVGSRVITTRIRSYKPSGSCIRPYRAYNCMYN